LRPSCTQAPLAPLKNPPEPIALPEKITVMMDKEALEALQNAWTAQGGSSIPKSPKGRTPRLALGAVRVLPGLYQARGTHDHRTGVVDRRHLTALMATLRGNPKADLDAVTVLRVGADNILIDGHHRLAAYRALKRKDIPARYFLGSPQDALLEAGRENGKDRLQMTRAQKSERAWALVLAGCGGTVAQVSQGTGTTERTVYTMRKRLKEFQEAGETPPETWAEVLRGRFDSDPEAIPKMVAEWAEALGKALPSPSKFNPSKVGILGDALLQWSGPVAEELTRYLITSLGLEDVAEADRAMRAEEDAEMGTLDF